MSVCSTHHEQLLSVSCTVQLGSFTHTIQRRCQLNSCVSCCFLYSCSASICVNRHLLFLISFVDLESFACLSCLHSCLYSSSVIVVVASIKVMTLYTGGLDFSGPVEEYFINSGKTVVDTVINLTGFALVGGPASQASRSLKVGGCDSSSRSWNNLPLFSRNEIARVCVLPPGTWWLSSW